jgi:hypothetical protein
LFAHDSDGLIAHPVTDAGPTISFCERVSDAEGHHMLPAAARIFPIEAGFGMPKPAVERVSQTLKSERHETELQ